MFVQASEQLDQNNLVAFVFIHLTHLRMLSVLSSVFFFISSLFSYTDAPPHFSIWRVFLEFLFFWLRPLSLHGRWFCSAVGGAIVLPLPTYKRAPCMGRPKKESNRNRARSIRVSGHFDGGFTRFLLPVLFRPLHTMHSSTLFSSTFALLTLVFISSSSFSFSDSPPLAFVDCYR